MQSCEVIISYFLLDLWPLEAENVGCNDSYIVNLESSYNGQYRCQGICMNTKECVGICYSYKEGFVLHCEICFNASILQPAVNGFGFYRNIRGNNIFDY